MALGLACPVQYVHTHLGRFGVVFGRCASHKRTPQRPPSALYTFGCCQLLPLSNCDGPPEDVPRPYLHDATQIWPPPPSQESDVLYGPPSRACDLLQVQPAPGRIASCHPTGARLIVGSRTVHCGSSAGQGEPVQPAARRGDRQVQLLGGRFARHLVDAPRGVGVFGRSRQRSAEAGGRVMQGGPSRSPPLVGLSDAILGDTG